MILHMVLTPTSRPNVFVPTLSFKTSKNPLKKYEIFFSPLCWLSEKAGFSLPAEINR